MNHLDPPAIVCTDPKIEARAETFLLRFKIAKTPMVIFLRDNIHELAALMDLLPFGSKRKFIKRMGVPKTTVYRWIAAAEVVPDGTIEPFANPSEDEPEEQVATSGTEHASPRCSRCQTQPIKDCPDCWRMSEVSTGIQTTPTPAKPVDSTQMLFCTHCRKFGPKKDCADCAEKRKPADREPGDDTEVVEADEATERERKRAEAEKKKNQGAPIFDAKLFHRGVACLVQTVDYVAKRVGLVDKNGAVLVTPEITGLHRKIEEARSSVEKWAHAQIRTQKKEQANGQEERRD